jgi:ABC-type multidrug transport system, ATPase and permease components
MKVLKQYVWLVNIICKKEKGIFLLYIGIALFGNIIPTIVSYSQKLFVSSLENASPFYLVVIYVSVYIIIKFIKSIYQYIDSFFAHKFIFKSNFIFNKFLTETLYKEPQENFYNSSFNDQINRVLKGYNIIPYQIFSVNEIIILLLVVLFIQLPLIVKFSPFLLLIIALDSIFSLIIAKTFSKEEYELEQKLTREQRKANYYGDTLSSKANAKEMRIFGAQNFFYTEWLTCYKHLNRTRNLLNIKKQKYQIFNYLCSFFINSTLLVFLFYQLFNKQIDFGTFIFIYNIVPATSDQIKMLIQSSLEDNYTNYLNIQNYIDYVKIVPKEVSYALPQEIDFHSIEVKNVSYIYPTGTQFAVRDVSLCVNKGEIVSILGYNGSGKTTLSKLITGILSPKEGEILLNGKNIINLSKEEVSSFMGIAYQDFTRYLLSVKDNIGFGYVEKYTDDNVKNAFQAANCYTLNTKLTDALDTKLGKSFYTEGIDLSGGEWQKLALARSYMGNHCVLILDEPTASIDPIKEIEMLSHFRKILEGRTAILISHRIGFARLADRIVMMDDGMIIESGTHEELLDSNGFYSKLFHSQKELYI